MHYSPNLDILGLKFDSWLTFENHVGGIASPISQRIGILRLVKYVFGDSVLLRCYYEFVFPILEYCPPVWDAAAECHLPLLELQVYSVDRLCLIKLSCRCVIDVILLCCVYCTRLIQIRIIVCLVSFYLLLSEFDIYELRLHLIHQSLKHQGVERANLQGVSCLPRLVCGMTFVTLCLTLER